MKKNIRNEEENISLK